MTGKELSRDLLSLEKQITAQMYVWTESIGIDSEVLDEARFDDSTEDIMTLESTRNLYRFLIYHSKSNPRCYSFRQP